MPSKSLKLYAPLAVLAIALLIMSGCGKSGEKYPNQEPEIQITSYEGYYNSLADTVLTDLLAPYADSTFLFQQKIFWNASDPDGVIEGFAFRVKDQNGNPIPTPRHDYIDLAGDVTPQNVIDRFGTGWVLHYKTNTNQDLPLDDPEANRTIWSSQKYATINFPAADENGDPLTMESTFEVIAIDNRGGITPVDPYYPARSIAWRTFNSTSDRPTCTVTTTRGNPNGGEVGSGLRLSFTMKDTDPFIDPIPHKFEFRIMKVDPDTEEIIDGTMTEWFASTSLEDPDMDTYLLTRYTDPALTYDVVDDVTNTLTRIESRAYDLAGVVSEVDGSSHITFAVKAGFRPQTLIYPQKVYALGDNHYIDYADESSPEILPFTIINGVQRFATPFFKDMEGNTTAVNSHNIKVWLRWGWHGEYGRVQTTGDIIPTDNPYDKKVDLVLDGDTDENYFSEITHFDLRFDGAPYNYPPYANSHVTDADGTEWLRIPLYSPLGQTLVITALESGVHTFEVRCVDLQGEVDPDPAVVSFDLIDPVPVEERSGILVIDDESANTLTAPEPDILNKYESMLSGYTGTKTFIKRTSLLEEGDTYEDTRLRHLATSDLQEYKLVIYHCDNPSESGQLKNENDGLSLYMSSGGNVLISHTSQLASVLDAFVLANQKSFIGYFGIPYVSPPARILSNSLNSLPFFQQAIGQEGYPDIDLQIGDGEPSFNPIVNLRQGLSTITYFPSLGPDTDVIYQMGIKEVGQDSFSPTQEQYDLFNLQPIGLRRVNPENSCYILGFPLSYMQEDDAREFINQVISEVM
ncbi:MAG: hypothetical protein R6T89_08370 [Candidatus Syntrophosphaera sp.]